MFPFETRLRAAASSEVGVPREADYNLVVYRLDIDEDEDADDDEDDDLDDLDDSDDDEDEDDEDEDEESEEEWQVSGFDTRP